jgi:hypothetical protein
MEARLVCMMAASRDRGSRRRSVVEELPFLALWSRRAVPGRMEYPSPVVAESTASA